MLARALDAKSVSVFAGCLTQQGACDLEKVSSSRLKTVQLDITDKEAVTRAYQFVQDNLGKTQELLGVVNNAGVMPSYAPIGWTSIEEFENVFKVNVLRTISVTLTVLPLLRKSRGRLITVCSMTATCALPGIANYVVSISAAKMFTDCLRYDCLHKWLVFLSAGAVTAVDVGFFYALGKLFVVIMREFGNTRAETAVVQSTTVGVFLGAGIVNGALIHRFGPRKVSLFGASFSSLGLIASFFATSTIYLIFSIGICMAFGSSILYISSAATVGKHFVGKKSLIALSVLSMGSGIGGMIYPYLLTYLNNLYGLRGTLLIIGGIKLNSVAAALMWGPPAVRRKTNTTDTNMPSNGISVTNNSAANENAECNHERKENNSNYKTTTHIFKDIETTGEPFRTYAITYDSKKQIIAHTTSKALTNKIKSKNINIVKRLKDLFRNRCFVFYIIGISLIFTVLTVFGIFIVDIFSDNGLSDSDSSLGLLLLNIFSVVGRLLPGLIMQKANVSVMAAPILSSIIGTTGLVFLLLLNSLEFYLTVCCMMGLSNGLIASAVSVTTMALVGKENLPNAIGAIFSVTGVANAAAGPISGMVRDKTGSYTLVFGMAAIAAVVGLIFFVIASCLQTRPKRNKKQRMSIFYVTKL